jgi:hypothetical protein
MRFKIGSTYTLGYGIGRVKIEKPTAKGKTFKAVRQSDGKSVHFGDADMRTRQDNPKAKASYCSRADKLNERGFNPNTLSLIYWDCIPGNPSTNEASNMRIILATNTSKTTVNKTDGKYQINGIPVTVDDAIMNGIKYPADENKKGMQSLNGMPMTLTHPADEDGRNVSVFSPNGIDYYSGGKVTGTYNKDGTWYADAEINEKKLRATDMGEYFADRLDNGEPIGVSTGLTFDANNECGDDYDKVAMNQQYDHLAMLHESEQPAGGDATVMRFNGQDVEVYNFDDFVVNSNQEQPVESIINRAITAFANKLGIGYNSQEFDVNHQNEDLIMDRSEMLEALGLATNSQVTDDELKTLMKSKLAANASGGFTKEDVESIVNAAIKPLADQLTANAEKELDQLVDQVVGLKIGINKEVAKTMGANALKDVLEANGAEYVAEGYNAKHEGRQTSTNSDDGEYRSRKPGLEE